MKTESIDFIILCLEDELKRTYPLKHVSRDWWTHDDNMDFYDDIKNKIRETIKELKQGV